MDPFAPENKDREEAILRAQAFLVMLQTCLGIICISCLAGLVPWLIVRACPISLGSRDAVLMPLLSMPISLFGGFFFARALKGGSVIARCRPTATRMVGAFLHQRITEALAFRKAVIVAPDRVWIGEGAIVTSGTVIAGAAIIEKGAHLSAETSLGDGVWIGARARLDGFCEVGPRSKIAPAAQIAQSRLGADVTVGEGADIRGCTIGVGAIIEPNVRLRDATIAAGATVYPFTFEARGRP